MNSRKIAIYYAWDRPAEIQAPLEVIEDRFPALFESRRMLYPRYAEFGDASRFEQGIAGFLDHIMRRNFTEFVRLGTELTSTPVVEVERVDGNGHLCPLDQQRLEGIDTLIIISFDSLRTHQHPTEQEIASIQAFLAAPDHLLFVCPHHDIGSVTEATPDALLEAQLVDFLHHGDRTIPPRQGFGGFARALLAGLGLPVHNCHGLRPAVRSDGSPAPIETEPALDRLHLLDGVETFNLHPHLPHLKRQGDALAKLDVLARQKIELDAPRHPFTANGATTFDALLQSRREVFAGTLLVSDTTLFSATAGGLDSLRRLWTHVVQRPLVEA